MDTPQLPCDKPTLFESTVCSRCGGGGHYSYNMLTGSRCFKCGGRGRTLTKRGAAAQEFYRSLLRKPVEDFKPGELVYAAPSPFTPGGFATVEHVGPSDDGKYVTVSATFKSGLGYTLHEFPGKSHRFAATADQKRDARERALAYQETLTKAGTPRKRAAAR